MRIKEFSQNTTTLTNTVIFLDLDETLVHTDTKEIIEPDIRMRIESLALKGSTLVISSRNYPWVVSEALRTHDLHRFFSRIFADFRPKIFHVKHFIWELKKSGSKKQSKTFIFVDDSFDTINSLKSTSFSDHIFFAIHFDKRRMRLSRILSLIEAQDFEALLEYCVVQDDRN